MPIKDGKNQHENVSQVFAVEATNKYFYIVSELSKMNLEKYVLGLEESYLIRKEICPKEVLHQACKGLYHLHKLNIGKKIRFRFNYFLLIYYLIYSSSRYLS